MTNQIANIINDINEKGYSKIENFFSEKDLQKIDINLKNINDEKITKGDKIGYFPVSIKDHIISLIKLRFKSLIRSHHLMSLSNAYSFKKIANQYFCNTTDLIMLDSYFSAKSNEKIIDWHADIPSDLPSNPIKYRKWQRSLKFFIYLTDVDHDNGCLAYFPESNKINEAITKLVLKKKITISRFTELSKMRDLLIKNKNLRELLKSESNINKETIEMFIENSSFIQNGGDTKNYDIALKKGGMVIFDEFGFHRGSSPARTSRMVLRYLFRPRHSCI